MHISMKVFDEIQPPLDKPKNSLSKTNVICKIVFYYEYNNLNSNYNSTK